MQLHARIKRYEKKLEGAVPGLAIKLHSCILSPTRFSDPGERLFTEKTTMPPAQRLLYG
jgi:hypothetical protein